MIVCGVKLTHDGGVALIDDGKLVFSVEMEKIGNAERYAPIQDLADVFDTVAGYGYRPQDIDLVAVDGWFNHERNRKWQGRDIRIQNAPYRRGILSDDPLQEYRYRIWDLDYLSFPHYSGHVLGGYCASPYAARGEDAYVLAWDGAMFPCLYAVEARRRKVERLGIVFYLLGDAYHSISQQFHPFDAPLEWPKVLTLPGKIMAYIARGRVQERAVARFQTSYQAICATGGVHGLNDETYTEPLGKRILEALGQAIVKDGESDADMLASWHQFLEGLLVQSLQHKVAECHLDLRRNLILVGGCALNIKWNRALRRAGFFESIWVPPFPNDSGSAIGVACCALTARQGLAPLSWSVYSGPEVQIGSVPADWQARPCTIGQLAALLHETGEPVVFLNGRAELGPRALGNRSILASPRDPGMKGRLNWIKGREDYRPVAPVCLEDRAADVFAPGDADPYMLFDHEVRPAWRERVPAICHEDGTARVQTVNQADHPKLFALLVEFERLSGVPVLCNTSANWPGRGFFPDVQSATEWGRVPYVWCNDLLYQREQQDLGALR